MTYAGALAGYKNDVSSTQAFQEHHIVLPPDIKDLQYAASKATDGYPLVADFVTKCRESSLFAEQNSLKKVAASWDLPSIDVHTFAQNRGWKASGSADSWFRGPGSGYPEVLIVENKQDCHIYLLD